LQTKVCHRVSHCVVEMRHEKQRFDLVNFKRSVQPFSQQVKFKLLIAAIRNAGYLLRTAF
jgi:hypothetical protein